MPIDDDIPMSRRTVEHVATKFNIIFLLVMALLAGLLFIMGLVQLLSTEPNPLDDIAAPLLLISLGAIGFALFFPSFMTVYFARHFLVVAKRLERSREELRATLFADGAGTQSRRRCAKCGKPAVVYVYETLRTGEGLSSEFCGAGAQRDIWIPSTAPREALPESSIDGPDIRTEVDRLIYFRSGENFLVVREVDGERRLAFKIGYAEATSIYWSLKNRETPRPVTHAAWMDTVSALGSRLNSVRVRDCRGDTYYAELRLSHESAEITIDVRPSDAIVAAIRADAPCFFSARLLHMYGATSPVAV